MTKTQQPVTISIRAKAEQRDLIDAAPVISAPEPLAGHHELANVESSEPSLDDWLKRRATKNQANGSWL